MDAEAIDRIQQLALSAAAKTIWIDGIEYSTVAVHNPREASPTTDALPLTTLQSVIDYLSQQKPSEFGSAGNVIVNVSGPGAVQVVSRLFGSFKQRDPYVVALHPDPWAKSIGFGQPHPLENMIVYLLSLCVQTKDRDQVLAALANIDSFDNNNASDDGLGQTVTHRKGIAPRSEVLIKNPVMLRPMRTFPEVEQPVAPFILRFHQDGASEKKLPKVSLTEADGGAWKLTAIASIKKHLTAALGPEFLVIG